MHPIIQINDGKIRGKLAKDYYDQTYYSFQGIPYAKPPINKLRFKAPEPPEKWTGIRDATQEGAPCYSKNFLQTYEGSEDCLTLNVFTPKLSGLNPVMVWIHGGGFTSGSSTSQLYGPEFLVPHGIVLVTINYRTGALGFVNLHHDNSLQVPGNAGLKDMVMALKWVQSNIRHFGGDAGNVTIFGESAGGAAVHYLMLSPLAKGLFHKAIAQSGCALNAWSRGSKNSAYDLAKVTGFESCDERGILEHLQSLDVEELYEGVARIKDNFSIGIVRPFCPVIENPSKDAFLCEEPEEIMKSGRYNKVPLMMGYVSSEGMLVYATYREKRNYLLHDDTLIPFSMGLRKGSPVYKIISERIKEFYFKGEELRDETVDNLLRLYTDNYFFIDIHKSAEMHASSHPVYFYRFALETELNAIKNVFNIANPGTCHGDDFCYLFKGLLTPEIEKGSVEESSMQKVTKLWTNFAKFGNPTTIDNIDIKWSPIDHKFNYLNIDEKLEMRTDPEQDAVEFWREVLQFKEAHAKM